MTLGLGADRSGFLKAGHTPTLVAALLYFDVSFMAWVLLGPLAPFLREDLGLSATQTGLLTAIPLLGGSLFRPLLGALADRIGGRRTGVLGLVLTCIPLVMGWQFATTAVHFYGLGFMLGIAGASFAVALPLASRWYPPQYQGLAMGIAGAGNSGTLLATLFAPRIAERFGWAATFGLALVPIAMVLILFLWLARESPKPRTVTTARQYGELLGEAGRRPVGDDVDQVRREDVGAADKRRPEVFAMRAVVLNKIVAVDAERPFEGDVDAEPPAAQLLHLPHIGARAEKRA
jgi:NNP family nitrate/nitrite transporter-like MFS transporter